MNPGGGVGGVGGGSSASTPRRVPSVLSGLVATQAIKAVTNISILHLPPRGGGGGRGGSNDSSRGGGSFRGGSRAGSPTSAQSPTAGATPGSARRRASAMMSPQVQAQHDEREANLIATVAALEDKITGLRDELSTRQASYVRREGRYREDIQQLQSKVDHISASRGSNDASQALTRNAVYDLHAKAGRCSLTPG